MDLRRPADLYAKSDRSLPSRLPELAYLGFDDVIRVSRYGQAYIAGLGKFALTAALAGEHVGIREEDDGRWLVNFCGIDLGHAGPRIKSFQPLGSSTSIKTAV